MSPWRNRRPSGGDVHDAGRVSIASAVEDVEEVLHLEQPILGEVRAMYRIANTVDAELGAECIGPQVLRHLGIAGPHEFPQRLHRVLLPDLHDQYRTRTELAYHIVILWQHALVNLQELLRSGLVHVPETHSRNLEAR